MSLPLSHRRFRSTSVHWTRVLCTPRQRPSDRPRGPTPQLLLPSQQKRPYKLGMSVGSWYNGAPRGRGQCEKFRCRAQNWENGEKKLRCRAHQSTIGRRLARPTPSHRPRANSGKAPRKEGRGQTYGCSAFCTSTRHHQDRWIVAPSCLSAHRLYSNSWRPFSGAFLIPSSRNSFFCNKHIMQRQNYPKFHHTFTELPPQRPPPAIRRHHESIGRLAVERNIIQFFTENSKTIKKLKRTATKYERERNSNNPPSSSSSFILPRKESVSFGD